MTSFKFEIPLTARLTENYTVKVKPVTHAFTLAIYDTPREELIGKRKVWRGYLVLAAQEGPNADGQLTIKFQRHDRELNPGPYLLRVWAADEITGQGNMAEIVIQVS